MINYATSNIDFFTQIKKFVFAYISTFFFNWLHHFSYNFSINFATLFTLILRRAISLFYKKYSGVIAV